MAQQYEHVKTKKQKNTMLCTDYKEVPTIRNHFHSPRIEKKKNDSLQDSHALTGVEIGVKERGEADGGKEPREWISPDSLLMLILSDLILPQSYSLLSR